MVNKLTNTCLLATEMKARIEQFKDEKLGAKKKTFVETMQVQSTGGQESSINPEHPDVMDTSA